MKQYLDLCNRIVNEGEWVNNERTGKRCLTVINADLTYDVSKGEFPLVTTRKSYWKSAIAEIIGYLRGYDNAADFRALGTKTWDANANENEVWLNNPYRKGEDDMGLCYGAIGRHFPNQMVAISTYYNKLSRISAVVWITVGKSSLFITLARFTWLVFAPACTAITFHCLVTRFI